MRLKKLKQRKQQVRRMVIASKITLRRNFEDFLFPSTITYEDSKLIADEVKKIFKSNKKLKIFDFNNAHSIEMLYAFNAVNYVSDSFTNNDLEKLLLASKDFTTTIMVNEDDHIRIDARSYDDKILLLYDDVKEAKKGFECGISLVDFNDIREGDVIEAYAMEEIKR